MNLMGGDELLDRPMRLELGVWSTMFPWPLLRAAVFGVALHETLPSSPALRIRRPNFSSRERDSRYRWSTEVTELHDR